MNDSYSIVFVQGAGLTLGGTNVWALELAQRLTQAGRRVGFIEHEPDAGPLLLDGAVPPDVNRTQCNLAASGWPSFRKLRESISAYEECLPCIFVPADSVSAFAMCALIARQKTESMRVLVVGHAESDLYYSFMNYYERMTHKFVAVNSTMVGCLEEQMPDRTDDIVLRPCPVDVPGTLNRTYSEVRNPLRIVCAGRVSNYDKGSGKLMPIAARLTELGVDFELSIYGSGPYDACLRRDFEAADEEVKRRVRILGQVEPAAMPGIWSSADIVLAPSNFESTGLSMLEGMARGCVPVVTDCNGPRDIIRGGYNGWIREKDDINGIAENIAKLARDRSLLARMGAEAHATARDKYSYATYVPWFTEMCNDLWGRAPMLWPVDRKPLMPEPGRRSLPRRALSKAVRMIGIGT